MRIDSPTNPRIKAALRAVASGEKLLLEGSRALREALALGIVPGEIFLEGEDARGKGYGAAIEEAAARGANVVFVSAKVLRKLSDLPSERGIVALAIPPRLSLQDLHLSKDSLFVLLDGVQDPANVGAIVRSAEAFGAAAVLLTSGCASPFAPKAFRASAGSALRVPLVPDVRPDDAAAWFDRHGATLAGAAARGGGSPSALAAIRPLVLVIGAEGHGISPALDARLACRVTIPLAERVESLNAAVAAGLLLFIATRLPA